MRYSASFFFKAYPSVIDSKIKIRLKFGALISKVQMQGYTASINLGNLFKNATMKKRGSTQLHVGKKTASKNQQCCIYLSSHYSTHIHTVTLLYAFVQTLIYINIYVYIYIYIYIYIHIHIYIYVNQSAYGSILAAEAMYT